MHISRSQIVHCFLLSAALLAGTAPNAFAVSCTTSADMNASERDAIQTAASTFGNDIVRGDAAALQSASAPSLADTFAGTSAGFAELASGLKNASVTVENFYALHAPELNGAAGEAQFFCSRSASPLLVTVTLEELPAGEYALAIVHATGVPKPQQFAFILRNTASGRAPAQWQLAGFFARPLTLGGHSGLWFWNQARVLTKQSAPLSAYLYYSAASELARPADLYTSGNLDKLGRESALAKPKEFPGESALSIQTPDGSTYSVTSMRIDTGLGAMDIRIDADVAKLGDAVASRTSAIALMSALLSRYPDVRRNFHGLWVFEKASDGQTYAVEQPMSSLP